MSVRPPAWDRHLRAGAIEVDEPVRPWERADVIVAGTCAFPVADEALVVGPRHES